MDDIAESNCLDYNTEETNRYSQPVDNEPLTGSIFSLNNDDLSSAFSQFIFSTSSKNTEYSGMNSINHYFTADQSPNANQSNFQSLQDCEPQSDKIKATDLEFSQNNPSNEPAISTVFKKIHCDQFYTYTNVEQKTFSSIPEMKKINNFHSYRRKFNNRLRAFIYLKINKLLLSIFNSKEVAFNNTKKFKNMVDRSVMNSYENLPIIEFLNEAHRKGELKADEEKILKKNKEVEFLILNSSHLKKDELIEALYKKTLKNYYQDYLDDVLFQKDLTWIQEDYAYKYNKRINQVEWSKMEKDKKLFVQQYKIEAKNFFGENH